MKLQIQIKMNEDLYLRNPEQTELGKNIIKHGIQLIHKMGFESFTFKKLAEDIGTTEAGVYRYFENKHRLLLYFVTWYWSYLEYNVVFNINNMTNPEEKIRRVLDLLTHELDDSLGTVDFDKKALYNIVINESNKVYLSKDVDENNSAHLFKPYKDLCARIADLFSAYNPNYPYARSLASTVIEAAHFQYFFAQHLPRLTNVKSKDDTSTIIEFLEQMVFAALSPDGK